MRIFICLMLALIGHLPTVAQVHFENAEQYLNYVREHQTTIQKEVLSEEINRQRLRSTWAAMWPQVRAFATLDNNVSLPVQLVPAEFLGGEPGEYAKVQFGTRYSSTFGVEASMPIINTTAWKNIQAASLHEQQSHYQVQDVTQSILEQAVAAYYFGLLGGEAMRLKNDLVSANDSLLKVAAIRYDNGVIEPLEYNRIKSIYLESLQQAQHASAAYSNNLSNLKVLSGIPTKDTVILSERISLIPITKAQFQVTSHQSARYHMLVLRTTQAQLEWKKQRMRLLPEISAYARYYRQAQRDAFNFLSNTEPWFDIGMIGLRAEWNIFTGLHRYASIRQATLQNEISEIELDNYQRENDRMLQELRINRDASAKGITMLLEHYTLAKGNYSIAGEKYSQGVYTLDQFIIIYQEMVRSQNQYLQELANYLVNDSVLRVKNDFQSE